MRSYWKLAAFVLAAGVVTTATFAQAGSEKVLLKRAFKVGAMRQNKLEASISPESGTGFDVKINVTSEDKCAKVNKDGNGEFESKQTALTITVNGNEMPGPASEGVEKSIVSPRNVTLSVESSAPDADFGKRLGQALAPYFPEKEVSVGETWKHEFKPDKDKGLRGGSAVDKLLSVETVDGVKTAKISHTYEEKPLSGDEGTIKVTATFWIDVSNGEVIKLDGSATGIPGSNMGAQGTVKMTMILKYVPPK
jgi:hypothetical protein